MSDEAKAVAIKAMQGALYFARNEVFAGACSGCDPGGEGAEIWGEIAADLCKGIVALGGVPNEPARHQRRRP